MPRNHDEALEWPDENTPTLEAILARLELEAADGDDSDPLQPLNTSTEDDND